MGGGNAVQANANNPSKVLERSLISSAGVRESCKISHDDVLTCGGGRARASVLAVVSALVDLAALAAVVGLAATLGLLVGVQEAAAAVQTLNRAGPAGGSCKGWQSDRAGGCGAPERKARFYSQRGDSVGVGVSTQVPLFSMCPLGQVQTGPLGLSRHSHSHFFLSQGLFTKTPHRHS